MTGTGTGLDSPLWIANWSRSARPYIARVPEGAWWFLAFVGFIGSLALATTGPW